jgi:predicted small integral membrane protein
LLAIEPDMQIARIRLSDKISRLHPRGAVTAGDPSGLCRSLGNLAKIGCVAAIAFYVALVAFGNLSDYWTNFAFVTEVLDMDAVPAASHIRWRAVTSPVLHHAGYILIIATEIATAALCALGAIAMVRQVLAKAQPFHTAKSKAVAG